MSLRTAFLPRRKQTQQSHLATSARVRARQAVTLLHSPQTKELSMDACAVPYQCAAKVAWKRYLPTTGLQSFRAGEYVEVLAAFSTAASACWLPLECSTLALETWPLGAIVTRMSTDPRNGATESGMSGGTGVRTLASAFGRVHAAATIADLLDSSAGESSVDAAETGVNAWSARVRIANTKIVPPIE